MVTQLPSEFDSSALRRAQLIAFDNDGTLYPAGLDVAQSVLLAHADYVQQHGLDIPTPSMDWVRRQMGADAKYFYGSMLPDQPQSVIEDFEEFCLDYETQAVARFTDLYPGAEDLLAALATAGKTIVLISNGSPRYVDSVWAHCGYGRFMVEKYPYGPPDFSTKGERLVEAIRTWGGPALMVGDRESDKHAAEYAGTPFIGCAYGYGEAYELAGASAVVESIAQLRALLL
jgi:phosphoglycolate phosphatase